jgi:hypothetical protein
MRTMRHADFPVEEVDPKAEGPTFTLAGETFRCLPEMPAGAFLGLPADGIVTYTAAGRFIRACIVEEDEPKLDAVLASKSRIVGLDQLHPIFQHLLKAWNPDVEDGEP